MAKADPHQLYFHRIDPGRNMRRFYALTLQPTLFGGASVIRRWGRIGTGGQSKVDTFDRPEAAAAAFARLERTKRRRGYREPPAG